MSNDYFLKLQVMKFIALISGMMKILETIILPTIVFLLNPNASSTINSYFLLTAPIWFLHLLIIHYLCGIYRMQLASFHLRRFHRHQDLLYSSQIKSQKFVSLLLEILLLAISQCETRWVILMCINLGRNQLIRYTERSDNFFHD